MKQSMVYGGTEYSIGACIKHLVGDYVCIGGICRHFLFRCAASGGCGLGKTADRPRKSIASALLQASRHTHCLNMVSYFSLRSLRVNDVRHIFTLLSRDVYPFRSRTLFFELRKPFLGLYGWLKQRLKLFSTSFSFSSGNPTHTS